MDSANDKGRTPLRSATSSGHLDIVKLLQSGADFNIHTDDRKSAFDLASDNGKAGVGNFLSGHDASAKSPDGVKPYTSILQPRNKPSSTAQTLRKGEEKVKPSDVTRPALYAASKNGQLDVVRSLLDQGSDVNETDSRRRAALHAASRAEDSRWHNS